MISTIQHAYVIINPINNVHEIEIKLMDLHT